MKCFIDTANLDEVREATAYGLLDVRHRTYVVDTELLDASARYPVHAVQARLRLGRGEEPTVNAPAVQAPHPLALLAPERKSPR